MSKSIFGTSHKSWPTIISASIAVLLIAWMALRPDRVAQLHEVAPEIVAQVRAALPNAREMPAAVSIRFQEASDGTLYIRKQLVEPVARGVNRRGSWVYDAVNKVSVREEATALSIGPVVLVRHIREPVPFVGALLPNYFWFTRLLKRVEVKPGSKYPGAAGDMFEATLWTEIQFAEGVPSEMDQAHLICTSGERVPARSVFATLEGDATKIHCEESGPPISGMAARLRVFATEEELKTAVHTVASDSWFIHSLGTTIQTSSRESIKIGTALPVEDFTKVRTIERLEVKPK